MQNEKHIYDAACAAFGFRKLRGGVYEEQDANGHYRPVLWIDYIWLITVDGYYWYPVTLGVAVIHPYGNRSETSHKGILLTQGHDEDTYIGKKPYQAFDLGEFDDPIPKLLRQVDLLPAVWQVPLDHPEGGVGLSIHTFVDWAEGSLRIEKGGLPTDANGTALWKQLKTLILDFAQMSLDEDVRAFIAKGPIDRRV
jgi:hypothetical protein